MQVFIEREISGLNDQALENRREYEDFQKAICKANANKRQLAVHAFTLACVLREQQKRLLRALRIAEAEALVPEDQWREVA